MVVNERGFEHLQGQLFDTLDVVAAWQEETFPPQFAPA